MSDKCKKTKGGKELTFCQDMAEAVSQEYAQLQTLRDNLNGKRRQRIALVKKRTSFPLLCCPWCRANIDTTPAQRAAQAAQGSE